MQGLSAERRDGLLQDLVRNAAPLRTGIDWIADDGMADRFEVHANLVRAAGVKAAANDRRVAE